MFFPGFNGSTRRRPEVSRGCAPWVEEPEKARITHYEQASVMWSRKVPPSYGKKGHQVSIAGILGFLRVPKCSRGGGDTREVFFRGGGIPREP